MHVRSRYLQSEKVNCFSGENTVMKNKAEDMLLTMVYQGRGSMGFVKGIWPHKLMEESECTPGKFTRISVGSWTAWSLKVLRETKQPEA